LCANYTPTKLDAISQHRSLERALFDLRVDSAFDYPAESFPGYMAPMLREARDQAGLIEAVPAMFGMVPHWADVKLARQTYNARTETVATKPSFRNAWKRNQFCVIPADNFYEPNYETGKAVRWRIEDADGAPLGIAGIWEVKPGGDESRPLLSFSMLTINADGHPLMQRFHKPNDEKRMLMLLDPAQYQPWLAGALVNDPAAYQPWPAERLIAAPSPMSARTSQPNTTSLDTPSLF
jgi:putative SOS response-associated peptidase YedK